MQRSRVNTKLLKIFLLQLVLISAVTSTGVYLAAWVAENVLVKRALIGEADYFWQRYRADARCSLPNSLNLLGYLDDGTAASTVPEWLTALSPGMHRVPYQNQRPIVFVSEYDGRHLYLIFNEEQVSRLSFYFGTVPLTLVLLVLYALAYLAFIMAKRAISPIVRVAETMEKINAGPSGVMQVTQINFTELRHGADAETIALVDAIQGFLDRIGQFIVRERNFTRYASHELRTPLTVIKASAANLLLADLSEKSRRHVDRIQATVQEMEALLETLLLLAREDEIKAEHEWVCANDVAALVLDQFRPTAQQQQIQLTLTQTALLNVNMPARLLTILLTNLIKNALDHTEQGTITVKIEADRIAVKDTGTGIAQAEIEHIFDPFYRSANNQKKGFGLGLAIVQKICEKMNWRVHVSSAPGEGAEFTLLRATPITPA